VGRYNTLQECKDVIEKSGGTCAHNCHLYSTGPADCDHVVNVFRPTPSRDK
jgi:hypothetical protein